jgi:hypothetical protein
MSRVSVRPSSVRNPLASHPALRERHDLNGRQRPNPLARLEHALEVRQLHVRVDIHVGADVRGAAADRLPYEPLRLPGRRQAHLAAHRSLVLDTVGHGGPSGVRAPALPPERLVEVHMRIDEPWEQDAGLAIGDRHIVP